MGEKQGYEPKDERKGFWEWFKGLFKGNQKTGPKGDNSQGLPSSTRDRWKELEEEGKKARKEGQEQDQSGWY